MKILSIVLVLTVFAKYTSAQTFIPLWPEGKIPSSRGIPVKDSVNNERLFEVGIPGIHCFITSMQENKGAAVLIIPGGGYHHLSFNVSGFQLAKWFNTIGINAFVLNHRLPISPNVKDREKAPVQDAERAMRIIRANAGQWNIDITKIGAMGSSAGGHLAACLGTIKDDFAKLGDQFDQLDYRPNFLLLISPVIDMGQFAHKGSRDNLLGPNPAAALVEKYSLHKQVDASTPATFLVHAFNDRVVSPQNSLLFYQALLDHQVVSSLHIFDQGAHSIALRNNPGATNLWTDLCEQWLLENQIIK